MNLIFDIGNTSTKCAIYDGERQVLMERTEALSEAYVDTLFRHYPIGRIIASVVGPMPDWEQLLPRNAQSQLHLLSPATHLPIKLHYNTPETLGMDRVAAICGARTHAPKGNLMVVDAGSCITVDLLTADNCYEGGAILPGIKMQLRAMNQFTAKLPLVEYSDRGETPLIGKTTEECLLSGTLRATAFALEGYIAETHFDTIFLTGGDAPLLKKLLRHETRLCSGLLMEGLNRIIELN